MIGTTKGRQPTMTAASKRTGKAIKATAATRRVPEGKVPAELRNLYRDSNPEDVSLDFDGSDADEVDEVETEKLFSVKGTEYHIPVEFGPGIALLYLDRIGEGRDVAVAAALKDAIGPEGWRALQGVRKQIKAEQMMAIMDKVQGKIFGAVERIEGN